MVLIEVWLIEKVNCKLNMLGMNKVIFDKIWNVIKKMVKEGIYFCVV